MTPSLARPIGALLLALVLAGCAGVGAGLAPRIEALLPADLILLGEQHDADDHRRIQRAFVETLADQGRLAALVLEMADSGRSTTALGRDASAAQVRDALQWHQAGWPWERYAPVIMAAVQRGVPVLGANLPRTAMRSAMGDDRLDRHLGAEALARQREALRTGHCDLLPPERLLPMLRVQLARDAAMAQAASLALVPGKTVLLIAGAGHVLRDRGIPTHLPASLRVRTVLAVAGQATPELAAHADLVWPTAALPARDHCAELRG